MKVIYHTHIAREIVGDYDFGDKQTYKLKETVFCCPQMKEAWGEYVVFGEKADYDYGDMTFNKNNHVNITSYKGWDITEERTISFCPFCGEGIETREGKRFRVKRVEYEKKVPAKTITDHKYVKTEEDS